jgi:hypothetical protein
VSTEETITELARLFNTAYERYRRIVRIEDDATPVAETELASGPQPSPHEQ